MLTGQTNFSSVTSRFWSLKWNFVWTNSDLGRLSVDPVLTLSPVNWSNLLAVFQLRHLGLIKEKDKRKARYNYHYPRFQMTRLSVHLWIRIPCAHYRRPLGQYCWHLWQVSVHSCCCYHHNLNKTNTGRRLVWPQSTDGLTLLHPWVTNRQLLGTISI